MQASGGSVMKDANDIDVKWPDVDTAEIMELFPGPTHSCDEFRS